MGSVSTVGVTRVRIGLGIEYPPLDHTNGVQRERNPPALGISTKWTLVQQFHNAGESNSLKSVAHSKMIEKYAEDGPLRRIVGVM